METLTANETVSQPAVTIIPNSLFIAVPAYDGKMAVETMMSLLTNIADIGKLGWSTYINCLKGLCYIDLARNQLIDTFLKSPCSHIFFVDADMGFDKLTMRKLIQVNLDMVCAAYPKKREPLAYTARSMVYSDSGKVAYNPVTGLLELDGAPTGLLLMTRTAVQKMWDSYPELEFENDEKQVLRGLFSCEITDRRYWGEDYQFSKRWKALGGKIWCVPDIDVEHHGVQVWKGNFQKYLESETK